MNLQKIFGDNWTRILTGKRPLCHSTNSVRALKNKRIKSTTSCDYSCQCSWSLALTLSGIIFHRHDVLVPNDLLRWIQRHVVQRLQLRRASFMPRHLPPMTTHCCHSCIFNRHLPPMTTHCCQSCIFNNTTAAHHYNYFCYDKIVSNRHPFNSLFSETTWVSQHQKG